MAHNLHQDRMAYVGETPWHGLGTRVPPTVTAHEMIRAARLDWRVEKRPAPGAKMVDEKAQTYDRYLIHRERTGDEKEEVTLALVGKGYEPLQNIDAFAFFEPFIDNKWARFETAGALGNGEHVWVLARLTGEMVIAKDDVVERFLLLSNTHDGSGAVTIRFTPIRVVCQNTLNLAKEGGTGIISVRHTKNIATHLEKAKAAELRRIVDKTFAEAATLFGRMALLKMQAKSTDWILNLLFPQTKLQKAKGDRPERWTRIEAILADDKVTPAKTRDTLWALYNAIVRDEDYRSSRESTAEARLQRVWFGGGHDLKLRALTAARRHLKCESAWNKDPVFGVIGIQSGPRR